MDQLTNKRSLPVDVCQFGSNCYRKNPHHFMEYRHQHLENIINGKIAAESYEIPAEMMSQRDLILEQIKVINELFPRGLSRTDSNEPSTKRNKMDQPTTSSPSILETTSNSNFGNVNMQSNKDAKSLPSTSQRDSALKIDIHKYLKVVPEKGQMERKLTAAHPYNYFLTCISSSPPTHKEPLSVTFQELLDKSLGELECSVQINFMVEIGWLLGQYFFAGYIKKPLLLLYGSGNVSDMDKISMYKPQVTAHLVKMPTPFSTHHTKMMLFAYTDNSMRVVVSTANLYEDDWDNRTQGLWISNKLQALPEGSDTAAGESPTEFRNELLKYLSSYKIPDLQPWLVRIRKTNFSQVNVFLVTSVPGTYQETAHGFYPHGHGRIASLLAKHSAPINDNSVIVAQSSSLGSFGSSPEAWIKSEFVNSFRRDSVSVGLRKIPNVRIIYPSFNNVANSHDGLLGGGCLPYNNQLHSKQLWLNDLLFQWKADIRHRSKAMPHIKTYARWSENKLYWFVLTSANLSKAAWGSISKSKISPTLRISNYEAGIVFLPKFVTNSHYFSIDKCDTTTPVFPPLYNIPLTKYMLGDTPFLSDILLS